MPAMMLLLLAASVAPTDAGLGAATVLNPVVPVRVRRMLNVESGLNDGLCTPFVLFAIAALAGEEGLAAVESIGAALQSTSAVGIVVGVVVGAGAGLLLGWSREHGWSSRHTRPLAVLVLPLVAYFGAELSEGNAFVAAFVAGTAFAGAARWLEEEESTLGLTEALADPLGFAVWFTFGFIAVPLLVEHVGWDEVVFALARAHRAADGARGPRAARHRPAGRPPSPSSAGSGPAGWPRSSSPCSRRRGSTSTRT